MIYNTEKPGLVKVFNISVFQLIFLLSQKTTVKASTSTIYYWVIKTFSLCDPGTLTVVQGPQPFWDIGKKYMMGWVGVGLLAYKSTANWHDSSFCSIIHSAGGSCSNNFHFSLCLAFPSNGNGRSTMIQTLKSMNLWRNLAQNAIVVIPLQAKQLLPAVVHFYLDELLREVGKCPSENL